MAASSFELGNNHIDMLLPLFDPLGKYEATAQERFIEIKLMANVTIMIVVGTGNQLKQSK